jgi:hypothetical protein
VITPSLCPRRIPVFSRSGPRTTVFWLLIAALSLVPAAASASDVYPQKKTNEKPYAVIFGTVWGPDDKPLYGVKVKIRRENEKKTRWEAYSDHHGEFAVRVPAGKAEYIAWADVKGNKSRVTIHVEFDERVDTGLHLK